MLRDNDQKTHNFSHALYSLWNWLLQFVLGLKLNPGITQGLKRCGCSLAPSNPSFESIVLFQSCTCDKIYLNLNRNNFRFPMIPQQGPSAPSFAMYNEKHVPRLPLFKFRVVEFIIANTMMLVTLRFGLPGPE